MEFKNFFGKMFHDVDLQENLFFAAVFAVSLSFAVIQKPEMIFLPVLLIAFNLQRILENPEIAFAFFALSSLFNSVQNVFPQGINIAIVTFPVLIFALAMNFAKKRNFLRNSFFGKTVLLFAFFVILMFFSAFWSPNSNDAFQRFLKFLFFAATLFFAPALIDFNFASIRRFALVFFASIFGIAIGLTANSVFFYFPGIFTDFFVSNTSFVGLFFAAGFFSSLFFFFQSSRRVSKLFFGIALFFMLFSVFAIKSVGPVLDLFFGILLMFLLCKAVRGKSLKYLVFAVVVSSIAAAFLLQAGFFNFLQPSVLLSDNNILTRLTMYDAALKLTFENPVLGYGLGSFPIVAQKFDSIKGIVDSLKREPYPHNIFLEASSEPGLIGLAVLLVFLIFVFCIFWKKFKSIESAGLGNALLFALILLNSPLFPLTFPPSG